VSLSWLRGSFNISPLKANIGDHLDCSKAMTLTVNVMPWGLNVRCAL
jgi:hypothetical protein